jgi:membrane fusion protein (multidrug efflux system)
MSYPFQRTLRSLNGGAAGVRVTLVSFAVMALCALACWTFEAEVPVLKVSTLGRIEPHNAVHRIEPPEAGRVVYSWLELDRHVSAGDLLIEFDAREQRLELGQSEASSAALTRDLALVRAQIVAKEAELAQSVRADQASLLEASAKETELIPRRMLAQQRAELAAASPSGAVSNLEKMERVTEAEVLARSGQTQALGVTRLQQEQLLKREGLRAQLLLLKREQSKIEGQLGELEITIARLHYEIEKKFVRAPASGRLVDVVELGEGAFIAQGQRLGTIVATGTAEVRVRARFPKETVGIVRSGQAARLKLDGYPWSIYGTVPARVSRVGTEPGIVATPEAIPGSVRVELIILEPPDPRVRIQHGLTTTVEIEVARVSPITLLMRAIGEWSTAVPEPNEPSKLDSNNIAQAEAR